MMVGIPKYDPDLYTKVGYDELVVVAAVLLEQSGKEITFENLVAICFECFPKRFALRGYPQWPDASVVNKSWLRCRSDKKYLTGSVKDAFRLTARGMEIASSTHKTLRGAPAFRKALRGKLTEKKTREGRFLRSLEESRAYRMFQHRASFAEVTDFDVSDMLLCTTESLPLARNASLDAFRGAARTYGRADILIFLEDVRKTYPHLFTSQSAGGMMPSRTGPSSGGGEK